MIPDKEKSSFPYKSVPKAASYTGIQKVVQVNFRGN